MGIRITSKKDGFRRCGIEHAGTKEYEDGKFTAEEVKRLKAEPMLMVESFAGKPKADDSKKDDKKEGK